MIPMSEFFPHGRARKFLPLVSVLESKIDPLGHIHRNTYGLVSLYDWA